MPRIFDVRDGEGGEALWGFAALLMLIITGHTVLEAARDALLLAGPGPRALGIVYMAIALCAWPAAALTARVSERFGARASLIGTLAVAACAPVALFAVPAGTPSALAVYVVSGLIGSIVVPQFWTLVGKVLTPSQGRRLFGLIAAAGVVGGVLGSGAAAACLLVLPVRALLLVSSALLAAAGAFLLRLRRRADRTPRGSPTVVAADDHGNRALLAHIAASVALSTATLLVLDYTFKSSLSRSLPGPAIGPFVARYYLALNAVSLLVQLFLGGAIVRRVGVMAAVALTPALIWFGALGVLGSGGSLAAVLLMKAVDGGLRFSLHRITGELVYLPVPVQIRQRYKPLIDGALARGSQTVTGAALLLLGGSWLLGPKPLALCVMTLAGAWLASVVSMRTPYLALLRRAISSGTLHAQDSPEPLDLESAKLLVQHLAGEDPYEVVGAMNALFRRGHGGFVPALVLLHPEEAVLVQALGHFGASDRSDWMPIAARLLVDAREGVRMAAARALARRGALDSKRLAEDVGPRVRGYAIVDLALREGVEDVLDDDRVAAQIDARAEGAEFARLGMLAAIADAGPDAALARLLSALGDMLGSSPESVTLFARAAAKQHAARMIPRLVELLALRDGREAVRSALVSFDGDGLEAVWWALRDTARPRSFRIHLPKTIARFGSKAAMDHLLEGLETEEDGLVRYKSIRALEVLVERASIVPDRLRVERLAREALVRHLRLLEERVALGDVPAAGTRAQLSLRLLAGLLEDKLRQSLERALRLLAVAHPQEDFRLVRIACMSSDPYARANAGELLDALLPHRDQWPLRTLLRLITDDLSPAARAARAEPLLHRRVPAGRDDVLRGLMHDRDPVVAALATACAPGVPQEDRPAPLSMGAASA
jgi:AAA family ATP:ADP antiporter